MIWSDLALKGEHQINNASTNSVGFTHIGRATTELRKPTLHDLFSMHAEARGTYVETAEEAATVFGLYDGTVNAFDPMIITSEFLVEDVLR